MVYIQIYIPDRNRVYDFKVSTQINILTLKSLVVEAVYNLKYEKDDIRQNYLLLDFKEHKRLNDDLTIEDYSIYNGEKFLLI